MALGGRSWAQIAAGGLRVASEVDAEASEAALVPQHFAASCETESDRKDEAFNRCSEMEGYAVAAEACDQEPFASSGNCQKEVEEVLALRGRDAANLLDAQTEECISGGAASRTEVSASSEVDACEASDVSTVDSERGECTLSAGAGALEDAFHICDQATDTTGAEAMSSTSDAEPQASSSTDSPSCACDATKQQSMASVNVIDGTAITAPPGLGPPGVWIWPSKDNKAESDGEDADGKQEMKTISWPETPIDSIEIMFVGRSAQLCFGGEFIKMDVSWADKWLRDKMEMPIANVQLHLKPEASSNFHCAGPLTRLQAVLARDQMAYQCQVFRMARSKDNTSMSVSCSVVSSATCWDVLKKGFCPRANCTWQHPTPTLVNLSIAGASGTGAELPTLLSKSASDDSGDESKIKESKDGEAAPAAPFTAPSQLNYQELNFAALADSDDSTSDDN